MSNSGARASSEADATAVALAARQLAQHLRDRPEDVQLGPQRLASQFGLPAEFVGEVLEQVNPRRPSSPSVLSRPIDIDGPIKRGVKSGYHHLKEAVKRLTDSPARFVATTTGVVLGVMVLAAALLHRWAAPEMPVATVTMVALYLLALASLPMHYIAYYRHALARNAVRGALIVFAMWSTAHTLMVLLTPNDQGDGILGRLVLSLIGTLMVSLLYLVGGVCAAVLGGYVRVRREERVERRMTRQQLLERLFEIQEKLKEGNVSSPGSPFWQAPWVMAIERRFYMLCAAAGLALNAIFVLANVAIIRSYDIPRDLPTAEYPSAFLIVNALLLALEIALLFAIGFLSHRPSRAFNGAVVLTLVSLLPLYFAIHVMQEPHFLQYVTANGILTSFVIVLLVMLVASLGAVVEERADWNRRLHESDPASLVAEMVRIQWRLSVKPSRVCVMVIDAVKSSRMKASADPYVVEYTFREYQEWIAEIVRQYSGSVYKTMGDGAVVQFPDSLSAFRAAQHLQTDIERFNRERNRLELPFRLRIGLHIGNLEGELHTVEFTEVIDIAAHVEKIAPIGSIAMTELVANDLSDERLVPLKDPIDGHNVYMAVQTRLEA